MRPTPLIALACLAALPLAGCRAHDEPNPAFTLAPETQRELMRTLGDRPVTLERPLLVIGGYRAPDPLVGSLRHRLLELTGAEPDEIVTASTFLYSRMEDAAQNALRVAEERFGTGEDGETVEVDVVGVSMGGLVARLAALPPEYRGFGGPRLRINRLFTIATPHRGSLLAEKMPIDQAVQDMLPASIFLTELEERLGEADYELLCYAALGDNVVPARWASPVGHPLHWVPGDRVGTHLKVHEQPLILLDIARRLRGEAPIATGTTPLPDSAYPATAPDREPGAHPDA